MDQIKIGAFMKELRKSKGLTQEQAAERLNVSNRTVSRWETGNNMPDIGLLMEISELYDVSIPELISGERKSDETNEEGVQEIARKMSDYAEAEKTTILRHITRESLLGVCALAILTILELVNNIVHYQLLEVVHLYCQVLVYVSVMMIFIHASGLLYKFRRYSRERKIPKPCLFLLALILAATGAIGVWIIISLSLR